MFFSGGMPRASYGDRHCVSLIQDANLVEGGDNTPQVAFDFTSRVVDFFTVKTNGAGKYKNLFLRILNQPPASNITTLPC